MADFLQDTDFPDRTGAWKELHAAGYKLWQFLDTQTTVWWASGHRRVLVQEQGDGHVRTAPLDPIQWQHPANRVGILAGEKDAIGYFKEHPAG